MGLTGWGAAYLAALLTIGLLDAAWLGGVARGLYQREIGELMRPDVRVLPAALFYIGYPAGLVLLTLWPGSDGAATPLWRGALLGLIAYGTYDLTNLATLRGWSTTLSVVDILWGMCVSAIASLAAWWAVSRLAPPG